VAAGQALDVAPIFDSLVQSRAVVLDELAARSRSTVSPDPELASLNASLLAARQRFANLMLRSLQEGESVSRVRLDDASREKERAERALAERSVVVQAELARARAGLADVRTALPPQSALVSFVRYDRTVVSQSPTARALRLVPSYLAFVMRSDSSAVAAVPLGSAISLEATVKAWREEAARGASVFGVAPKDAEAAYRTVGTRLRQRVWDPVTAHLAGVSHVFVVPDGALNFVSLAALPSAGGGYLGERPQTLHYVSTERDIVAPATASPSHGLLAVGGPAFGRVAAPQSSASGPRTSSAAPACEDLRSMRFDALPESANEVAQIARIWSSSEPGAPTVLTGRTATEDAVKRAVIDRQVVHLATHGFFLGSNCTPSPRDARSSENPLLLSGLAFAGANNRTTAGTSQDDGILTAEEVAGLNLQSTEWAVLSACDTGLGEIKTGEGVFGLRRAFQIAGARTVIMSLWSIDDEATQAWMRALYQARFSRHLSTADAMHDAGLTVLRARRARGYSTHPFYWAGFVAVGDWR
jgi:CHAT domain-containing protein